MYRSYEDAQKLEKQLAELKKQYAQAINEGRDEEELISLDEAIASLKDRVNFAWQDEYQEEG